MKEAFIQRFILEANEFCNELESLLMNLEENPSKLNLLEQMFRTMHSLKGSGTMFGFDLVSNLAHELESLFVAVIDKKYAIDQHFFDWSYLSLDLIRRLLNDNGANFDNLKNEVLQLKNSIAMVVRELTDSPVLVKQGKGAPHRKIDTELTTYYIAFSPSKNVLKNGTNPLYLIEELVQSGEAEVATQMELPDDFFSFDPKLCYTIWRVLVRTEVSLDELKDIFVFVEDESEFIFHTLESACLMHFRDSGKSLFEVNPEQMAIHKIPAKSGDDLLGKSSEEPRKLFDFIKVEINKIDEVMNLANELNTQFNRIDRWGNENNIVGWERMLDEYSKLLTRLKENIFRMRLIPVAVYSIPFRRLVRDMARDLGKKMQLEVSGVDTEMDKKIIDDLKESLMHLIRNCADHGIEAPEERKKIGKSETGIISFEASMKGAMVELTISDDGAGLSYQKIREHVKNLNLSKTVEQLSEQELIDFIFHPGFSTSSQITGISGRGFGMDVVKETVLGLHGNIEVFSEQSKGVRYVITVPVSISQMDGLLIKIQNAYYIIPFSDIFKIIDQDAALISYSGEQRFVSFQDQKYKLIELHQVFWNKLSLVQNPMIIIIKLGSFYFGLAVDQVIHHINSMVKPLNGSLKSLNMFLGTAIVEDGMPAFVLNMSYFKKFCML